MGRVSLHRHAARASGSSCSGRSGKSLARYFPEMVAALAALPVQKFVIDGELVIETGSSLSFDDLQARLHPAESRIRKLAAETPSTLIAFDMLKDARRPRAREGAAVGAPRGAGKVLQRSRRDGVAAPLAHHHQPRRGGTLAEARRRRRAGWRRRQAPRRPLSRRRTRHAEDQVPAQRRLCGRRLPLCHGARRKSARCCSASTTSRACSITSASRRHLQTRIAPRSPRSSRSFAAGDRFHRRRAGRAQPLVDRALNAMGAAQDEACGRSAVRPRQRRSLPSRHAACCAGVPTSRRASAPSTSSRPRRRPRA